jgi:capsular polysaccharide biosynthesis protein
MLLSPAVPPLGPRFPKLPLNIGIGIAAGLFLGMNLALLREMMDRRVRSPKDLADAIEGPVLALLERTSARVKRRRKRSGLFARPARRAQIA